MEKIRKLIDLFFSLAKVGAVTFGGGMAMLPILQRELIEKKSWLTEEELLDYYAIGQSTPGIIAVNVATFVGYKQAGMLGGIVATLGMVFPSIVIILLIAHFISAVNHFTIAQKALRGINVAVASLLTSVVFRFSKKTVISMFAFVVFALSFTLIFFFRIPSFFVILFAIALGIVLYFFQTKNRNGHKKNGAEK